MKLLTLIYVVVAASSAGVADGAAEGVSWSVTIVEVDLPDRAAVNALVADGYDVSNVRGNTVTIYATDEELSRLESSGYAFVEVGRQPSSRKETSGYHSYASMMSELEACAAEHSDICRLSSLGESVQGREIWALLITDNPDVEEDEPEFKYVSTIHGDEPVGTELCLFLIDRLSSDYGSAPRITELVDTTAIWIVPLMNPDGREMVTRLNANRRDLNRAFPVYPDDFTATFYDGEPLGDEGRQPEAAHIMRWTAANSFVLSANLHTGTLVVNYPYDDDGKPSGTDAPTPDDALFKEISRLYSVHNVPMWENEEFTDGIANGSAWYSIRGGMQDWNYRFVGCNEVTIELSNAKMPSPSELPTLWADNEESMLGFIEAVHMGVHGAVTDRDTGAPLWAEVRVAGNDHPVFTDPDVGDYHRMLLPGAYTLTYSAPGYIGRTICDVAVTETRVDVALADADINNDGIMDAVDVQIVINALLGFPVSYNCDLDGSGLTSTDLQKLINVLLAWL